MYRRLSIEPGYCVHKIRSGFSKEQFYQEKKSALGKGALHCLTLLKTLPETEVKCFGNKKKDHFNFDINPSRAENHRNH